MTTTVFYDTKRNTLYVSGIATPFPAGSLQAKRLGDMLAVANPQDGTLLCAWTNFAAWVIGGMSNFADASAAFLALNETCSRAPARAPVVMAVVATMAGTVPRGSPVALSRANGQMQAARADTYTLAFVAGLADADLSSGFSATAVRTYVDREDWTPLSGAPTLLLGQPYFLGLAGGITLTPDRAPGNCLVRVGIATSSTRLAFVPADPVLL